MIVNHPARLLGVLILILALVFAVGTQGIEAQAGYAGLSARFLPTFVAIGLGLCGLGLLLSKTPQQQGMTDNAHQGSHLDTSNSATRKGVLWVLAGLIAHASLIGFIGFPLASALLMGMVSRGFGSRRWLRDGLIGLAVVIPVWLIFTKVLAINLPFFPLLR
jgi:putative tricarboxylic transport membrane protein